MAGASAFTTPSTLSLRARARGPFSFRNLSSMACFCSSSCRRRASSILLSSAFVFSSASCRFISSVPTAITASVENQTGANSYFLPSRRSAIISERWKQSLRLDGFSWLISQRFKTPGRALSRFTQQLLVLRAFGQARPLEPNNGGRYGPQEVGRAGLPRMPDFGQSRVAAQRPRSWSSPASAVLARAAPFLPLLILSIDREKLCLPSIHWCALTSLSHDHKKRGTGREKTG
jgi:hypothetical protein